MVFRSFFKIFKYKWFIFKIQQVNEVLLFMHKFFFESEQYLNERSFELICFEYKHFLIKQTIIIIILSYLSFFTSKICIIIIYSVY